MKPVNFNIFLEEKQMNIPNIVGFGVIFIFFSYLIIMMTNQRKNPRILNNPMSKGLLDITLFWLCFFEVVLFFLIINNTGFVR